MKEFKERKVGTIIVTSLDRLFRSLRNFLDFIELVAEYKLEFISLKEQYDTTSPQGRLLITIMMALAQFERELTAQRNKNSYIQRAERGLWYGGHVFRYDFDQDNPGILLDNPEEQAGAKLAFDTYVEKGSIASVVRVLNDAGYRTKQSFELSILMVTPSVKQ
jgi:DNA invertase Pin-like site-specific DNA recombinase